MTIHVVSGTSDNLGYLQMSAARAREFLIALRDARSPLVATGDENGTLEITWQSSGSGSIFSIHPLGERHVLHHCLIDQAFDMEFVTNELLADLGA